MQTYIAMLRGINVSGQKMIKMEALRVALAELGLNNIRTYIQSGNIIFESPEKESGSLVKLIEAKILEKFGFQVPVIIRTPNEIKDAIATNPFLKTDSLDNAKLYLTFLAEIPGPDKIEKLNTFSYSPEEFILINKDVYLYCPSGYGNAKLNNNFFENKLKTKATTRNWQTVNKLLELSKT